MAHSLDLNALLVTLTGFAPALCAETSGLRRADREDVAQDTMVQLLESSGGAATGSGVAQVLGGMQDETGVFDLEAVLARCRAVLRNRARNLKRRLRVRSRVEGGSERELDAVVAPAADMPQDWWEALTADERTWLEGILSQASNEELAKVWGVHRATVKPE